MPDLTKLTLLSTQPAFHNNKVYTGFFTLPSTAITGGGVITQEFTISLDNSPSIVDILFNENGESEWFKSGNRRISQSGTQSGSPTTIQWDVEPFISGNNLKITASTVKQFTATFTPNETVQVNYRVVDYSSL